MAGEVDGWEEVLERLAAEIFRKASLVSELRHYERVRKIRAPTAKLVYLFLKDHQSQILPSIKRILGVSRNSAPRAMEELVERGFVVRDDQFLYWVTPLEPEGRREKQ